MIDDGLYFMHQIPKMDYLTVARPKQKQKTKEQAEYSTPVAGRQPFKKQMFEVIQGQSPRLRLKDYLRLTTITKRSNSNSVKKHKQSKQASFNSTPKSDSMFDTLQSLNILRDQLKVDLHICLQKLNDIVQKVQKNEQKLQNEEQQYEQLVFSCELHRIVKQNIQTALERAGSLIAEHKQRQYMKFMSKTGQILSDEVKKSSQSTYKKRKNGLYASRMRSQNKLQQSQI